MITKTPDIYPGANATPAELLKLADSYQKAAGILLEMRTCGGYVSLAPFRLNAIHAIELYLNALLIHSGQCHSIVRGLQHKLGARTEIALTCGLILRKRTITHLIALENNREYLHTRYLPERLASASQINRLSATLHEIANKVRGRIQAT